MGFERVMLAGGRQCCLGSTIRGGGGKLHRRIGMGHHQRQGDIQLPGTHARVRERQPDAPLPRMMAHSAVAVGLTSTSTDPAV